MDPLAGDTTDDSTAAPIEATPTPSTGDIAAPAAQPTAQAPTAAIAQTLPSGTTGLRGVLDSVLNFLSTRPTTQTTYDDQGKHVTPAAPSTTGQNAKNVIATALTGAARAAAAPPGPGHVMQGAAQATLGASADVAKNLQDQDANAQQVYDAAQKAKLNSINYQLGIRKIAESDLTLKAMAVKATQDQIDFADRQADREKALGSYDLGVVKDAGEIADTISKLPDWQKQLYAHEGIQPHPVYDESGNRLGLQLFMRKPDVDSQPAPEGTKVEKFNPPTRPGDQPTTTTFTPVGASNSDIDKYKRAYLADSQAWQLKEANAAHLKAETDQANANATRVPSEIAKNKAEANKANADAAKATVETANAKATGDSDANVDAIGTGKIALNRLDYLLSKNPALLDKVTQKYPDFDSSKVQSYISTYKEFTSTKPGTAGRALNAGGTALKHLAELNAMNTVKSHIPGTADHNAYMNKVDTLAPELATFYGDATVPAIAAIKGTLSANLPGTRHAAIQTQAKSMGDKFDSYEQTWKNAAPSKAYEAPMPQVDPKALEARAALDPAYRQREVQQQSGTPTTPTAASGAALPPPATHHFSPSAWQSTHPGQDVQAAIAQAKAQGYTVGQ